MVIFYPKKVVLTNWLFPIASGLGSDCFFNFDIFQIHSDFFCVVNALYVC